MNSQFAALMRIFLIVPKICGFIAILGAANEMANAQSRNMVFYPRLNATTFPALSEGVQISRMPNLLIGNFSALNPPGYLASIRASVDGVHFCTWFFVGDQILVGAYHCLYNNARSLEVTLNPMVKINAVCEAPSDFGIGHQLDVTLCLLDRPYNIPIAERMRGDGFERVENNPKAVKTGRIVRISGYGCHSPNEKVEDKYAIGESKIYRLPPNAHIPGATQPTPNIIQIRQAPAFLCEGDSGGPAFLFDGDTGARSVFGVNSATATSIESGYITSLVTPDSKKFFLAWSQRHGQKVCGLDVDAVDCRSAK